MVNLKNILIGILVLALGVLVIGSGVSVLSSLAWNTAGTILPATATITEDTPNSTAIGDLDTYITQTDALDTVLTFTPISSTHITVSVAPNTNIATLTPAANWVGTETITFNVSDADDLNVASAPVAVTVTNVNDAPVFDTYQFYSATSKPTVGTAFSFTLNATDADTGDTLTYSVIGLPATSLSLASNKIIGTPVATDVGIHTATVNVTDGTETVSKTVKFRIREAYEDAQLDIDSIDINNLDGKDTKIYPGNKVEIEIKIENDGNQDIEDITVTIENKDLDIEEESAEFDINEGDDETILFEVELPYDAENKKHYLEVYVKGKGDTDNKYHSAYYYTDDFTNSLAQKFIEIEKASHDLTFSKLTISKDEANPGDTAKIEATIVNIGKRDEENVKVKIYNSKLGISEYSSEFDLDESDDQKVTFNIDIPKDAETGDHIIEATISYDKDSSDEESNPLSKTITLKVAGGTAATTATTTAAATAKATLAATTASMTAKRGSAAKYELTLSNTGTESKEYEIKVAGVTDWATYTVEAGGEASKVTIPAGNSLTIYVYLTPKTDATSGAHTATVNAYSGTELVSSVTLTADVSATTAGTSLTGAGVTFSPSAGTVSWIIVGGVIVLIALITAMTVYKIKKD